MVIVLKIIIKNEAQMKSFAQKVASCVNQNVVIYLQGDLGAGKTTLARAFIQYFNFGKVKSPTYSLVESYINSKINIHHFDLYRLNDAQELDYIGIREYSGVQLIEWAEFGKGMIKNADMIIKISGNNIKELEIITLSGIGKELKKCINL